MSRPRKGPRVERAWRPLVGDPKRPATELFRALDYQIWLTISAWIDLGEDEALVVEGVEDFDILSGAGGLTTQVKALCQPISLRSACVVEGMRNFWQTKHSNPGRPVEYRFVTTAEATVEAGEPFGPEIGGLSLWTLASQRGKIEHAEGIRQFIMSDASVGSRLSEPFPIGAPSLMDFLTAGSIQAVFEEFLRPIQWLTGREGVETAREMVSLKLHAYGETMGLMPGDSDRALSHLFECVAHRAFKEHRVLSREEFRLQFQEATQPSQREVVLLQRVAGASLGRLREEGLHAGLRLLEQLTLPAPSLPRPCAPRDELVRNIAASLFETGFAGLHGSTGTGKSTLGRLVLRKSPGGWGWLDLAGLNSSAIRAAFVYVTRAVSGSEPVNIVFDNFDPSGADAVVLTRQLAAVTQMVISGGGKIVVTAQRTLPERFRRETELPEKAFFHVPNFDWGEVCAFCCQAGCPDPKQAQTCTAIILAQTAGHPQLVHACVSIRQRGGWPAPSAEEALHLPTELKEERQMARQLLQGLEAGEVELLYRLSLLSGSFRRDQAIAVAEISPTSPQPGDTFDRLLGPWIEPASGGYFRLSNLLSRSAEENWSKERVDELRALVGRAIIRCGRLTQVEASEVLLQAIVVRDADLAAKILAPLMLAPLKHRADLAGTLSWLFAFTKPEPIFANHEFTNLLLRQVQFRLAAATNHESAPYFAEITMAEAGRLKTAKGKDLIVASITGDIVLAINILVSPRLLLLCWRAANRVAASSEHVKAVARYIERRRPQQRFRSKQSYAEILFGFILCRRGGPSYLLQFLAAVDELSEEERLEVAGSLRANPDRLLGFTDSVWLRELEKPVRQWEEVLAGLKAAWEAGKRWKLPELIDCAARGIATVQDEYLDRPEKALAMLAQAAQDCGEDRIILRLQRGIVFSRQSRHTEAYDQWVTTLDHWKTDDVEAAVHTLFTFSKCGTAAGNLNNWKDAARIFKRGRDIALGVKQQQDATSFGVDAAYALWRSGDKAEATSFFARCLVELEEQARGRERGGLHTLWKLTEHVIRWCAVDAGSPSKMKIDLPRPGLCSEPKEKERHKILQERPRGPIVFSWFSLAEAELGANVGREVFDELVSRHDCATYPSIRAMIAFLRLRRAFHDREFAELPLLVEELGTASSIMQAQGLTEDAMLVPNPSPPVPASAVVEIGRFGIESFPTALLILASAYAEFSQALGQWRDSARQRTTAFDFDAFFARIDQIVNAPWTEARTIYQQASEDRLARLLSSLRLVTCPDSSLAWCFVGSVTLVTDDGLLNGFLGAGAALGLLMCKVWLERLRFPAEFKLPRTSIPAIQAACDQPHAGAKLAAKVLLAAQMAVATRLPENMFKKLKALAGSATA